MTGNVFSRYRRDCTDAGMDDFVAKPVDMPTLYAVVLKWLSVSPASARGGAAAPDRAGR